MARGYSRHKGLGNRCEVKAYIPPKRLIDIAAERTQGLVTYLIDATVQSGKFIAKEEL